MEKLNTNLFMLISVDGKISTNLMEVRKLNNSYIYLKYDVINKTEIID